MAKSKDFILINRKYIFALSGIIAGVCEAMTYVKQVGLDVQMMLDSISKGEKEAGK